MRDLDRRLRDLEEALDLLASDSAVARDAKGELERLRAIEAAAREYLKAQAADNPALIQVGGALHELWVALEAPYPKPIIRTPVTHGPGWLAAISCVHAGDLEVYDRAPDGSMRKLACLRGATPGLGIFDLTPHFFQHALIFDRSEGSEFHAHVARDRSEVLAVVHAAAQSTPKPEKP